VPWRTGTPGSPLPITTSVIMWIPGVPGIPTGQYYNTVSNAYAPQGMQPAMQMPYAPMIVQQQQGPSPWAVAGGAALGTMAGFGLGSLMFGAPMWGGLGGWGFGGYGFGSGLFSPFPTFDNWNGGFNWPGVF
jgi:hypothetical protein